MNNIFLVFCALSILGLGVVIGSLLCTFEEWSLGSTVAFSRIGGGLLFIGAAFMAFIVH